MYNWYIEFVTNYREYPICPKEQSNNLINLFTSLIGTQEGRSEKEKAIIFSWNITDRKHVILSAQRFPPVKIPSSLFLLATIQKEKSSANKAVKMESNWHLVESFESKMLRLSEISLKKSY